MILLDTHVLVWYLVEPEKMSPTSRKVATTGFREEGVGIADITLWEVAMLVEKKRLIFNKDVEEWLGDLNSLPNFSRVRISPSIAALSTRLPGDFHHDPADRMIVATAIDLAVPLVTKDQRIQDYPYVKTIW